MLTRLLLIFLACLTLYLPCLSVSALSFDTKDNFKGWGSITSLRLAEQGASPVAVALSLVNTALTFLGIVSSAFILYAGFLWFTGRDNEEQIKKATDIIKGALIGLAIVLLSYGISYAIWWSFSSATYTI